MKDIIAGGRNYEAYLGRELPRKEEILAAYEEILDDSMVSGGCSGVDKCGEEWAEHTGVQLIGISMEKPLVLFVIDRWLIMRMD